MTIKVEFLFDFGSPDAYLSHLVIPAIEARSVFGSPSFFVGSEHYFGKDQLRDVEEEIERRLSVAP